MGKKFGYFDNEKKEYIITTPLTPLPWINYIGNDELYGIISNTAGGYTFYKDASLMRITRYRYNNYPLDMGGRYIYIKAGDGEIFSPTFKPCMKAPDKYECHHGMGYTRIISAYKKIETEICYFMPREDNVEIWDCKIRNSTDKKISLDVYPFVEFCLWNALDDFTNFQRNFSCGEVYVEDDVIYHITEYRERRNHFAYFASNEKPVSFETRRNEFIGLDSLINEPEMLKQEKLANGIAYGWALCAVQQLKINLEPGEEKRIIFQLGYSENKPEEKFTNNRLNTSNVKKIIEKYKDENTVDKAFNDLKNYWNEILGHFQVKSSNEYVNSMVNIWNQYQNMITYKMSRSASFFEAGIGRGMGFRDSNQDLLGFMHMDIEKARQRILDLAATQLENGHAYHQYQPLTKKGNKELGTNYNDDPLWMVMSSCAYVKETGDADFLDTMVPFENDESKAASLYEHLIRSLKFTITHKGPHGIPLIGRADWNDCLNCNTVNTIPGLTFSSAPYKESNIAESVLIGFLFVYAAKEFKKIAEIRKDDEKIKWISKEIEKMKEALEKHAWDGEWWLRAYDANSEKIGSNECEEGKIYIEPQGWAVIANVGTEEMQRKAMQSVKKHLAIEHGIMLHQPAYTKYYLNIGEISTYPPGYKENASIFCHTNPWIMIGEALLKNCEQALEYYLAICPAKREDISDIHKCEPYVYAQMIAGKDAPTLGEAKNSWLTGTAAWNFVAISRYLLGIRPEYDGLLVDPGVPESFGNYEIIRKFRGTAYNIKVEFVHKGETCCIENGKETPGNFIKHIEGAKERNITVKINVDK